MGFSQGFWFSYFLPFTNSFNITNFFFLFNLKIVFGILWLMILFAINYLLYLSFCVFSWTTTCFLSNVGHPFSSGITLAKLAAVTMDEQGNEIFDTSGALDKLRKVSTFFPPLTIWIRVLQMNQYDSLVNYCMILFLSMLAHLCPFFFWLLLTITILWNLVITSK